MMTADDDEILPAPRTPRRQRPAALRKLRYFWGLDARTPFTVPSMDRLLERTQRNAVAFFMSYIFFLVCFLIAVLAVGGSLWFAAWAISSLLHAVCRNTSARDVEGSAVPEYDRLPI
ncbi:hypothetical protein SPRG_19891 [Saprolegnia parasitica CBS 223.65]|uniref:PRA1 family protein n=1 Tax=Saprolegnia parasitica (strain CBS 223.65) TaxID=695850 RepID=A0A067CRU1_SAPPC|nr:hypothetical protein SPRG_19891 [Saprolegnia parasitica CBS 223.65]KDO29221.1 hypothetical protein SPRG_19891 [Saprolegnia parasitica CBS 223.65]|eukprot:XP_012200118.1 hypothetical protein SPRG_19891 [Saprolegnia parasitica CBS 223.65]